MPRDGPRRAQHWRRAPVSSQYERPAKQSWFYRNNLNLVRYPVLIGTGNTGSWSMAALGARWEYLHIAKHGGHVSFFNLGSLASLAQQSGFSVAAVRTRGVRFCEKDDCAKAVYRIAKIAGELLNVFAALLDKGHDMAVYLRRS